MSDVPAYWSCFAFQGVSPDDLHCTHKYFGELNEGDVSHIIAILDEYFSKKVKAPTVVFDTVDMFGKDNDIRVLRPSNEDMSWCLLDLKAKLDIFAKDNHPSYKPHVTTDFKEVSMPMVRYCFCLDDDIIKEYSLDLSFVEKVSASWVIVEG